MRKAEHDRRHLQHQEAKKGGDLIERVFWCWFDSLPQMCETL